MGKLCKYVSKVGDDLYLCTKYKSYCYLDDPNENKCNNLYGNDNIDDQILEDEDNVEESV